MTTSNGSSPPPNDDGVRYEYVNDLDVLVYVDDRATTSAGPGHPAAQKIRERDREQIAELIAWTQREQEKLNSRKRQLPRGGDDAE